MVSDPEVYSGELPWSLGAPSSEEPAYLTAGSRSDVEHESATTSLSEVEAFEDDYESSGAFDVPVPLRLGLRYWPTVIGASLDRLTITGSVPRDLMDAFSSWTRRQMVFVGVYEAKPPYRWQANVEPGGIFQCAAAIDVPRDMLSSGVALRYDFNPSKVDPGDVRELLSWFHYARVTRVDVAVDYLTNLCDVVWSRPRSSSTVYRGPDGRLESVYFGAASSRLRFNCYDKAREREFCGEIAPDPRPDWWRAEARHRPSRDDDPLPLSLFDSLDARLPALDLGGKWRDLALVSYCREHPEYVRRLNSYARKQMQAAVVSLFPALEPAPALVYLGEYERLARELGAYFKLCASSSPLVAGYVDFSFGSLPLGEVVEEV